MKNKSYKGLLLAMFSIAALILAACQPAAVETKEAAAPQEAPAIIPLVEVSDQEILDGTVQIAKAVSDGPGWIVIHAQAEGKPGPVIGYAPLKAGENLDVTVQIDLSQATEVQYAMLHQDAGIAGTYEFPGEDGPVTVNDQVVTPSFKIIGFDSLSGEKMGGHTVMVAVDDELGEYLVDKDGMTLYLFTKDEPGVSNCEGGCLEAWPPLLVDGEPTAGEGVTGELGTITLADGTQMVTYNDIPLYYYAPDQQPGDILGQGVGDVWYVLSPDIMGFDSVMGDMPAEATVMVAVDDELGEYLVDKDGMTLYLFTLDEPGVSNCEGGCLEAWPPLLVEGEPVAGEGVTGKLGTITLADGTQMVTYNDIPLYYYASDQQPGDIRGQGVGDVWFVVSP